MSKTLRGAFKSQVIPPPDITPPTAPTSLGVSLVSNVPVLTWTASTDNVLVIGYQVWRKLGSGGVYAMLSPTTPALTFSDSGALAGNIYFYKVAAFDAAGNVSSFSNEVSQAISLSDVTAPNIPAQPTLVTSNNAVTPPTFQISWPSVTDIDPGSGAPVSGENNYDVRVNGTIDPTPVANSVTIGAFTSFVIGTNSGGSIVTGSDSGTVLSCTSTTNDINSHHWSAADEYFTNGSLVQGPGYQAIHFTAQSPFGAFSKVGIELRQDRSASAQYIAVLSFGSTNGLKVEWRLAAGGQATGSTAVAHPGFPFWLRQRWDANWNCIHEYSTNSTNPNPVGGDGSWTNIATQLMSFGIQAYVNKFADANTNGATGGTVTGTYDQYVVSGASPNIYNGVGIIGTNAVDVRARDFASNISVFGTPLSFSISSPVVTGNRPNPSFGGYFIGPAPGFRYDNSTYQAAMMLRRSHIMAWAAGWDGAATQTMKQIMSNIRSGSTIIGGTKSFLYWDPLFVQFAPSKYVTALNTNHWYVYNSFTNGQFVKVSPGGGTNYVANYRPGGPLDSAGRDYAHYAGAYVLDAFVNGGASGLADGTNVANPFVDGWFFDDMWTNPTFGADWSRTGTEDYTYPGGDVSTGLINGVNSITNVWANSGQFKVGGNGGGTPSGLNPPASYIGKWDGPVIIENALGDTNSAGNPGLSGGGFNFMLQRYQLIASTVKAGGYMYFATHNVRTDGSDIAGTVGNASLNSPARFGVRYQFGCCTVLGDADYSPEQSVGNASLVPWFDWFSINIATRAVYSLANAALGSNWLGDAIDPPQTSAWSNGIYRRRFTNATIYLNPQGNGAKSNIALSPGGHYPSGSTDPLYNGAAVTTWSPADRDSIIVLT